MVHNVRSLALAPPLHGRQLAQRLASAHCQLACRPCAVPMPCADTRWTAICSSTRVYVELGGTKLVQVRGVTDHEAGASQPHIAGTFALSPKAAI